jgi:hypothetical protein
VNINPDDVTKNLTEFRGIGTVGVGGELMANRSPQVSGRFRSEGIAHFVWATGRVYADALYKVRRNRGDCCNTVQTQEAKTEIPVEIFERPARSDMPKKDTARSK